MGMELVVDQEARYIFLASRLPNMGTIRFVEADSPTKESFKGF
jgi:hypothetical protein